MIFHHELALSRSGTRPTFSLNYEFQSLAERAITMKNKPEAFVALAHAKPFQYVRIRYKRARKLFGLCNDCLQLVKYAGL